jgi:hypothetical protein
MVKSRIPLEKIVCAFNKNSGMLQLRLRPTGDGAVVEVFLNVSPTEPFIDTKIYLQGHAVIYLNDAFCKTIAQLARKERIKIAWNNLRTYFWEVP